MASPIDLQQILPVYKVEHDCVLSRQGDITLAYELTLPELFTLSDADYEAFHQVWIKAIKVLPRHSIFHKQDWFVTDGYQADFTVESQSFLSRASERFFHERPYLDHRCYLMLTKKPAGRRNSSSLFSSLLRHSLVPEESISPLAVEEFLDHTGQLERILSDSGFVQLRRLTGDQLASTKEKPGLLEKYCYLLADGEMPLIRDIHFNGELKVGTLYGQLYTLADAVDLPSLCGSRINYDKYSTDQTKFSVGFASSGTAPALQPPL